MIFDTPDMGKCTTLKSQVKFTMAWSCIFLLSVVGHLNLTQAQKAKQIFYYFAFALVQCLENRPLWQCDW